MTGVTARTDTPSTPVAGPGGADAATDAERARHVRRLAPYLGAGSLYLLTSVALWWHVWSTHPSTVMTCDCTDAGRAVWYLEWSAFALTHGHQLLVSPWLFHPTGLNLLADTSVPAIAFVLSPVTLLAGPVVAVNVASTVIPVLTALSMFWLLRRWVRWTPAAFVGGLAYGFSALVIVQLAFGWLNLACLTLLPLMVGCVDELYIRQRRRPAVVGAALGALMTAEFFVSTETVLLASVSIALGTVVLVARAGFNHRGGGLRSTDGRRRAGHAAVGLAVAVSVTAALLAYPLWLFLAGPGHLSGMLWSTNVPGALGNMAGNFWNYLGRWGPLTSQQLAGAAPVLGGYRGPALPTPSYLGWGVLAVLVVGLVMWRSDRRLQFFAVLGVATAALSLRVSGDTWGPWSVVYHLPVFDNVVQSRFDAVVGLCAAVMLAIVVDRSRSRTQDRLSGRRHLPGSTAGRSRSLAARWGPAAAAGGVTLVALVPVIAALAPNLPLTVQPVTVPRWFENVAPDLPPGQVLLTYPFATADSQAAIPWQAIAGMPVPMAGGGGPAGTEARAGPSRAGFHVLDTASVPLDPAPAPTRANFEAVRHAMRRWGVTLVVVPDDAGLATFQTGRGTGYGVAFFTAVLGSAPRRQDDAWVWQAIAGRPPPVVVSGGTFADCVTLPAGASAADDPWARCVMDGVSRRARTGRGGEVVR